MIGVDRRVAATHDLAPHCRRQVRHDRSKTIKRERTEFLSGSFIQEIGGHHESSSNLHFRDHPVGLAIPLGSAFAQTKSLKQQLEGSYTLAKAFDTSSDGKDKDVWGLGVQGSLMLDPSGRFSLFIVAANRAKGESNDPRVPAGNIVAHYGTYTVDETAKNDQLPL